MSNQIENTGDSNIILQDIDSSNINITIQDGLPDDVKEKKKELKKLVDALIDKIDPLIKKEKSEPPSEETESAFKTEINLTLRALRLDRCVLFIGPEIALADEEGKKSLHEKKYMAMADAGGGEVTYNPSYGFFEPHDDPIFEMDMNEYYGGEFRDENVIGRETLYHLAQLPFKLIVSSSPDETLHELMNSYDKDHQFIYYEGTGASVPDKKPDKDNPLVFNMLGSAVSNGGRFIYTDKEFYEYVSDISYPSEIKNEIQQAAHLLFIGFNLHKWHTRLLMFMLGMHLADYKSKRLLLSHLPHENIEKFLKDQFKVTHVDYNYLEFARELARKGKEEKLGIDLEQFFFKKQMAKLERLSIEITDAQQMAVLQTVAEELENIEEKIGRHG